MGVPPVVWLESIWLVEEIAPLLLKTRIIKRLPTAIKSSNPTVISCFVFFKVDSLKPYD
jgi:hypothetical protein